MGLEALWAGIGSNLTFSIDVAASIQLRSTRAWRQLGPSNHLSHPQPALHSQHYLLLGTDSFTSLSDTYLKQQQQQINFIAIYIINTIEFTLLKCTIQ